MKIEKKKLTDLIPAPYNPRKSSKEEEENLAKSLKKFGVVEPIVFNKRTGYIVGGHFRVRELTKLGYEEVECVIVDLSEEDERELNIRLNANTGDWDFENSDFDWDFSELESWGLDMTGFDIEEEEKHLEAKEGNYEQPEQMQVDVVLGDLIEIGDHRLLCGDSTDVKAVSRLMDEEKADMITDPPYGIEANKQTLGKGKKEYYRGGDWDSETPDFFYLLELFEKVVIWGGNYFTDRLPVSNDWLCWHKKNDDRSFSEFELAWSNLGCNCRILQHHWGGEKKLHPTMKPVEVMAWCIGLVEGNIIFDPFLGSGSTMVAAHQLKRKCYGLELDPKYCQTIINRMIALDLKITVKINGKPYQPQETPM